MKNLHEGNFKKKRKKSYDNLELIPKKSINIKVSEYPPGLSPPKSSRSRSIANATSIHPTTEPSPRPHHLRIITDEDQSPCPPYFETAMEDPIDEPSPCGMKEFFQNSEPATARTHRT